MYKRFLLVVTLLLGGLIIVGAGSNSRAAGLAHSVAPTPAAEEETTTDTHDHDVHDHDTHDHDAHDHDAHDHDEMSGDTDETTIAELAAQVKSLEARVAALEASIQLNQVNNAIYHLDLVGLHDLDERLASGGVIEQDTHGSGDSSRVRAIARLMSTVMWPEELADDAMALIASLQELAIALADGDVEASAALAAEAHYAQHALSHAAEQWIMGDSATHHSHSHTDSMHHHAAPMVVDVDGLLIENVLGNLALPTSSGSIWLTITNNTEKAEALIGAAVPGCGVIELHDMVMQGDVMVMREVEGGVIPIPVGETVELKRGGLHIMCINKEAPLEPGNPIEITLEFANAGEISVTGVVVAPGHMPMEQSHDHSHDHSDDSESDDHDP